MPEAELITRSTTPAILETVASLHGSDFEKTERGTCNVATVSHSHAFYLLPVLPDMIERATFENTKPPKTTADGTPLEKDLLEVERYMVKARLRGKLYDVELIVKVKRGNSRELGSVGLYRNYYGHDLYEK